MSVGQSYTQACRFEHPPHPGIPGTFFSIFGNFLQTKPFCKSWPFANQDFCKKARMPRQHEQVVMQMNEVHRRASEWVQRGTSKVAP
jgi:hypothetical protein